MEIKDIENRFECHKTDIKQLLKRVEQLEKQNDLTEILKLGNDAMNMLLNTKTDYGNEHPVLSFTKEDLINAYYAMIRDANPIQVIRAETYMKMADVQANRLIEFIHKVKKEPKEK